MNKIKIALEHLAEAGRKAEGWGEGDLLAYYHEHCRTIETEAARADAEQRRADDLGAQCAALRADLAKVRKELVEGMHVRHFRGGPAGMVVCEVNGTRTIVRGPDLPGGAVYSTANLIPVASPRA